MNEKLRDVIQVANDIAPSGPTVSVGFVGSLAAMTINDWVGLLVGIATLIYLGFQIESALHKRRNRNRGV